jgi:hypothetical protein
MPRRLRLTALTLLILPGFALAGGSELENARKLRADKQPQAALDILEKLAKSQPKGADKTIQLELAITRLELARLSEPEQRPAILLQAANDLTPFLQDIKNADPQVVIQAARIADWQGKTAGQMARKDSDAAFAERMRGEAIKYFKASAKSLGDVEKRLSTPGDKLAVRLELGQTLVAQAGLYTGSTTAEKRARADLLLEARKTLEMLVKDFAQQSQDPKLYLARAWLVRCAKESGDNIRAQALYKDLLAESRPEAALGERWAGAFHIQGIRLDKAGLAQARKEAEDWLKAYADYRDAPEGAIVRFQLASTYAIEAQLISKDVNHPEAGKLYDFAQQEFAAVAELDGDLADKAREYALNLRFLRVGPGTPLDTLKDFDSCFLRGRYEMGRLQDVSTKLTLAKTDSERATLQTQRQLVAQACVAAFDRALLQDDKTTTPARKAEAQYLLARCYMIAGDAEKAMDASEALARVLPPTKYSASAAAFALEVGALLRSSKDSAELRKRLRSVAELVLKSRAKDWQNDPVTGQAHYQVAMLAAAENRLPEAISELEQLTPAFRDYFHARCQLAYLTLAARKSASSEDQRQRLTTKALTVIKDLPPLEAKAAPQTATLFFTVQVEAANADLEAAADKLDAGKVAQAAQQYAELLTRTDAAREQLDRLDPTLEDAAQRTLTKALGDVKLLATAGLARAELRKGDYDKVLKDTSPVTKSLLALVQEDKGTTPIPLASAQAMGDLLGVVLRAQIAKGHAAEARKIMLVLRRLTDEKTNQRVGTAVLSSVVQELKWQLRDQKQTGDKAALEATIASFSVFLDAIGKDDPTLTSDRQLTAFIAMTYAGLEKYSEAARWFAKIPEPKFDPKKKLTGQEQRDLDEYWLLQATYGRALREGKQYAEARKVLDRVLKDSRSAGRFLAQKELNHLLEDEGEYGRAITAWSDYLENSALRETLLDAKAKAAELRTARDLYFDGYYHLVWCHYKYGQTHKVDAKRQEYTAKAAGMIAELELSRDQTGWQTIGPRLQQLLNSEGPLRQAYLAAKSK